MSIANPNLRTAVRETQAQALRELAEDADFLNKRGAIKVKRLSKYDDPTRFEREVESVVQEVEANVVNLDVKLLETARNGRQVVRHYTDPATFLRSPMVERRLREARERGLLLKDHLDVAKGKLVAAKPLEARLREGSFEMGLYDDEVDTTQKNIHYLAVNDVVLPTLSSPHTKNALRVDYLDAHRKAWSAYTFNPIARRICTIVPQFVLGRGARGKVSSVEHQKAWDAFWKLNRMRPRVKQTLKELIIYGEIFWRFFETKQGLVVRSIDPSTIWDIVTNDDDIEDVRYYHQQYTQLNMSPIPGTVPTPATVVIRQIPADQMAHYKINSTSSEKRGRSTLLPILGYLLRLKEFIDDRILINKMRAMVAMDVAVEGDEAAVSAAEEQFREPPGPAAVFVHNKGVEVDFKNPSTGAAEAQTDADAILKVIAIGAGISADFLGVSRATTRAGALISTEPDVKNFEDYQEFIEDILLDTADRVFAVAKLESKEMDFIFPSIAQEDRSTKIKDVAFAEAMDYFSKQRAADMVAREFQISDYDFAAERQRIKVERGEDPVIATGLQQMPKVAPDPTALPPGMGQDLQLAPKTNLGQQADRQDVTQTSAQMGFKGDGGGRAIADTQATLNRSNFTRGGEKTALQNNRSTGTPLRHSAAEPRKNGWTDAARQASLAVRRAKAARRREQS